MVGLRRVRGPPPAPLPPPAALPPPPRDTPAPPGNHQSLWCCKGASMLPAPPLLPAPLPRLHVQLQGLYRPSYTRGHPHGQPTPMPSQTGLPPRTHPNGRRFWYLEMASSKIVIGKFFPTVLLRGQIIFVLVLTSSISIVQDQKHRQISMQKSTRVFRLRPPTRTRNRRVKHAKSDLRPNEWWQSAVQ